MQDGKITLPQALTKMEEGKAFDIEFCTCNRARGTGGELKAYSKVLLTNAMPASKSKRRTKAQAEKKKADPRHRHNHTKNIYIAQEKEGKRIQSVHLRLITRINGKEVL